MDYLKWIELLLGPLLTLVLTAIIVPYLRRLYRLHREEGLMIRLHFPRKRSCDAGNAIGIKP
jgi:hypothetical protein